MANKNRKKCSRSLIVGETEIKITRYHLTPIRMAIKKPKIIECWRRCGERGMLFHCWWECGLISAAMEDGMEIPWKTGNGATI